MILEIRRRAELIQYLKTLGRVRMKGDDSQVMKLVYVETSLLPHQHLHLRRAGPSSSDQVVAEFLRSCEHDAQGFHRHRSGMRLSVK
jgi:hypothetical protein